MIQLNSKIYIAGHRGFIGSTILSYLLQLGYTNLLVRTKAELDLLDQKAVHDFLQHEKPEYVILCAAKVGGILVNSQYQAEFLYQNLQIQTNVIHNSYLVGVKKLIFLASSCIYPTQCPQPMKEEYLYTGQFESTNYGYAVAKAAGVTMCRAYNEQYDTNYITVFPSNLYGPNDNFDLISSHALPALMRKIHEAKINNTGYINIWGSGKPMREWTYSVDIARIVERILVSADINKSILNIGTGTDISMVDLAKTIMDVVGYQCEIRLDSSKPDGMMRKVMDVSGARNLGLEVKTNLRDGLKMTYDWFVSNR